MAHDIADITAVTPGTPSGTMRFTLQIDISDSTTLSNVVYIPEGLKGAILECGASTNAITASFSMCHTYDGTFIPLTRPYSTGNAASVTVENPVIVSVSQAASAMNVSDLLCPGGYFLKVVMSGAEGTSDLNFYLRCYW